MILKKMISLAAGVMVGLSLATVSAQACTGIIVGKKASADGSTIIGRNEDMGAAWAKHFVVRPANSIDPNFVSASNGFKIQLPAENMEYTAVPEWDVSEGLFEEAGINSARVAMSATESALSNEKVLKIDPLVEDGIDEAAMTTVVLPYIHSAREGVERLGKIVEEHGSAETNGVAFSDKDEIWYLETLTGHHWVAARVPDDSYAVVANTLMIQEIDWDDPDNYMYSDGLKEFIEDNDLAEDATKASMREVFADTSEDGQYNTPRILSGQNIVTPSAEKDITGEEFETFMKPDQPITLARAAFVMRDRFGGTEYDAYLGEKAGELRSASVPTTMESHMLQIRNDVPEEISGIQWLALGVPDTSSYVPFYAGIKETPEAYRTGEDKMDTDSAYWLYRMTNYLTVPYYADLKSQYTLPVRQEVRQHLLDEVDRIDKEAEKILQENPEKLAEFLTNESAELAKYSFDRYEELNSELLKELAGRQAVKHNTDL